MEKLSFNETKAICVAAFQTLAPIAFGVAIAFSIALFCFSLIAK